MKVLMDDGAHEEPTFANIMAAFDWIVGASRAGDTVWIHYSGHGGSVRDNNGDEEDGMDETLIPVDFQSAGQIRDDDILKHLVKPMREGVLMTCLMDCCHSGTVLDLPYRFIADGDHVSILYFSALNCVMVGTFACWLLIHLNLSFIFRLRWSKMETLTLSTWLLWQEKFSKQSLRQRWLERLWILQLIAATFCRAMGYV